LPASYSVTKGLFTAELGSRWGFVASSVGWAETGLAAGVSSDGCVTGGLMDSSSTGAATTVIGQRLTDEVIAHVKGVEVAVLDALRSIQPLRVSPSTG
jgi:hypothetical protein